MTNMELTREERIEIERANLLKVKGEIKEYLAWRRTAKRNSKKRDSAFNMACYKEQCIVDRLKKMGLSILEI